MYNVIREFLSTGSTTILYTKSYDIIQISLHKAHKSAFHKEDLNVNMNNLRNSGPSSTQRQDYMLLWTDISSKKAGTDEMLSKKEAGINRLPWHPREDSNLWPAA